MTRWWDNDAHERFWVEIRFVSGIGLDLECSLLDERGRANAYYDLVGEVRPGDHVYHWNAHQHRFVGRSAVAKAPRINAQGRRYVELRDFRSLQADISLDTIRTLEPEIVSVRDRLGLAHPGEKLYLPFQFRSDGLRMLSNYFAKLPAELVSLLFDETGLGEAMAAEPDPEDGPAVGVQEPSGKLSFLSPFKAKADTEYNAIVQGGVQRRGRTHETLVNDFAAWLGHRGFEVGRNAAIDLGLSQPPVIIEAKVVSQWPHAIREAVGQLYEYRYCKVIDPTSALVFLASKPVPEWWIRYLEKDRSIGVAARSGTSFSLSALARTIFDL